jgi:hypothetical protein
MRKGSRLKNRYVVIATGHCLSSMYKKKNHMNLKNLCLCLIIQIRI